MAAASLIKKTDKMVNFMKTTPTFVCGKYGKIYFDRVSEDWIRVRQVKQNGTIGHIDLEDEDMEKLAKGLFAKYKQLHPETAQTKRPKTSKTSIAPKSTHMQQLKGKYENAYNKWTDDDEALLKRYHSEGKTNAEISGLLRRNTGAVRSRLKKLGLTGNNGAQTDSGNENSGKVASSKP